MFSFLKPTMKITFYQEKIKINLNPINRNNKIIML